MIDIAKARALVETLRAPLLNANDVSDEAADTISALIAEVERLKTVPMKYRRMAFNAQLQEENALLLAERDALARKLDAVREVYAGMEGFVPQTAPEGYCLRIIEQMAHATMKGTQ